MSNEEKSMKTTEIMIGDYVRLKKNKDIVCIFEIDEDRNVINNEPDGYDSEHNIMISEIEPIPITKEFLENNRFVNCNTIGEKFELRIYFDDSHYQIIRYYLETKELSVKTEYSYSIRPTIEHLRIQYVHELQNILRLCHIDKEIKL